MSRAYITYFSVAALLIAGLWVILTYGNSLEAPQDLSGRWRVKWDSPPPFSPREATMKIQQSGRFLQISFENSLPLSMKLSDAPAAGRELRNPVLRMSNPTWAMTLTGNPALGELRIGLTGATRHTGTASRAGLNPATSPGSGNAH